jgi:hypothetical protein
MDAVTAAVMVLLSCSPDLMLCRQPMAKLTTIYSSVSQCEKALADQLLKGTHDGRKTVGRCQAITEATDTARWGVSPNGELFYASASDVIDAVEVPGPDIAVAKKVESGPVTVRVTRGSGSSAVTTSYTVPRTSSD